MVGGWFMHTMQAWSLPNELVLEIAKHAAASSQVEYRTWLLLSSGWHKAVRLVCLQHVPVSLFSSRAVDSFLALLEKYPSLCLSVRHLWIPSSNKADIAIAWACTRLVSLACQSRVLESISSMSTFLHTSLCELTIMTVWSPWESLLFAPHALQLCSQITHLRHFEGLPPDFPTNQLTSLKHLSFASFIYRDFIVKHVARLGHMKALESIVVTTSWQRDTNAIQPQCLAKALQSIDKRLRVVHTVRGFSELGAWLDRSRLERCLWSVARPDTIVAVGPPFQQSGPISHN